MGKIFEGNLQGNNQKIGIVVSRFNEFITGKLLSGAMDCLIRHGVDEDNIKTFWVPGAYEIPLLAQNIADKFDGVICLGAVIKGATPHFDFVGAEVSKGIANVSLQKNKPISFGVITTNNIEQAIERAGTKSGNKGWDAALSVLEMCNLIGEIEKM